MSSTINGEPVIKVTNLTKIFRDFWRRPKVRAVDGLDLEVKRGEIFGLLGPNGSGKSTTIKILLGLLHPSSGEVSVMGASPCSVKAKSNIGYLPEESYLYPYLTAREALEFYGRLFDMTGTARKERISQLLNMAGLTREADRPVGEFSKGMARRVGLAQALINDPQLVILDEPTSGLDPIGCRQVKDLMLTLAQRGKTILLSSHLLADVEDVCDRVVILYKGRTRVCGRINELLEERESLRLTIPSLSPEKTKEVLALIRKAINQDPEIDRPSKNLEQIFIEVVKQAHKDSEESCPDSVAEYLSSD